MSPGDKLPALESYWEPARVKVGKNHRVAPPRFLTWVCSAALGGGRLNKIWTLRSTD